MTRLTPAREREIDSELWTGRAHPDWTGMGWAQFLHLLWRDGIGFAFWPTSWEWPSVDSCWYDGPHYALSIGPFVFEVSCTNPGTRWLFWV